MSERNLDVAIAQIAGRPGDIGANADRHLAAIAEARGSGTDILLFPELSLTGYLAGSEAADLALAADAAILHRIADAAGPMAVSLGFVERADDGRLFNAQVLLRSGRAHVHRKLNLPGYGNLREDRTYAPAHALDPVDIGGGWRAATLICADAWNPALVWIAALRGANLLLLPSASARGAVGGGFDNPRGWDITLAYLALTYAVPVMFANHCGGDFWGGSRILDADAATLAQAGATAQTVTARLDFRHGEAARARLPTVRDSRPELVRMLLDPRTDR